MKNKYFISIMFSTIIAFSVITGCGDKKREYRKFK